MPELPKAYIPKDYENKLYELWQKHRAFRPAGKGAPFSILMPPPNANNSLHVGNALMVVTEDIMIRYARMQGKRALWIPGTDHAGFETQVVYERKLQKEDKSRFDFTPDELRTDIRAYVQEKQQTILSQLKQLGASADWDTLYFTLDQKIINTVYDTFKRMHGDDLLYRAKRLVNFCTKHGTSFSDLEVTYEDRETDLVYIKYPLADDPKKYITVATTRPETMLGDAAVAVNPKDKRYTKLIGKKAMVPLVNREVPIVADVAVDETIGSGAVKVTPAHSHVDAEIAGRHLLSFIEVIDTRGKMTGDIPSDLSGLKVSAARAEIVAKLHELNLIEKIVTHPTRIGVCYQCKTPIEILPIEQWWVKTKPLAETAIAAIKKKQITVTPKESTEKLIKWLENIIDWNISRQIVWGIPIPAWFKRGEIKIQEQSPGEGWFKDVDTFDTWFSSTQLPFAALGYPEDKLFKTYFPTEVMETGADILYFWVARMIMMSLYVTGEVPFKHIYLHGLVLDPLGKKMSKSKGNVVDPLEIMGRFGTDALRWALIHGTAPGQNFNMTEDRVVGGRNLANKLWNAARYVLLAQGDKNEIRNTKSETDTKAKKSDNSKITIDSNFEFRISSLKHVQNKKIAEGLNEVIRNASKCLDSDQYGLATDLLYDFFWHQFCDSYLEQSKELLQKPQTAAETRQTLLHCLITTLKLFHPFMPFVTEAVWQELLDEKLVQDPLLITASWPKPEAKK